MRQAGVPPPRTPAVGSARSPSFFNHPRGRKPGWPGGMPGVVGETRGGAGGTSGSEAVGKAAPDGYTLLVADVGQVAINQHIFSSLPYDPRKDFAPVTLIGTSALFLALHPSVPADNFKDLISYIRNNPGKVNYGSSGVGSIHHLATEAMAHALGLQIVHVPYKGPGQAVPALLGGQVAMLYSSLPS